MGNYLNKITLKGKEMLFPTFFPDATRGVIRSLDSADLVSSKVEGLIVNTYHLLSQPGQSILKEFSGVKNFMNWKEWIISDSGGFQLLSMIYQNKSFGTITSGGVTFNRGSRGNKRRYKFTPEKSIQTQFSIGADIMICLDDCPTPNSKLEDVEVSVKRTIEWANRCKEEYLRQLDLRKIKEIDRPHLFAVIQGENDKGLREACAKRLIEIGFDGYGFGGWPINKEGNLNYSILEFTASLMPNNLPKYGLGIGNPQAIVDCFKMGYTIFDCVLPTRDARHQRLYIFSKDPDKMNILDEEKVYEYLHIMREKHTRGTLPISQFCDCYTCKNYSLGYLQHLFKIEDTLAFRLSTIHNLRTYTKLIELLRPYAQ